MARARGANALLAGGFESSYGLPSSVSTWIAFPFATTDGFGESQDLEDSELLGSGREPQDPLYSVINAGGNVNVPVDLRIFPWWLRLLFGAPTTVAGIKATGWTLFSDQPANNATLTLNGTDFTFKSSANAATEIQIGTTLANTIYNAIVAVNLSGDANATQAKYTGDPTNANIINVEAAAPGTGGNAYTLVASTSPASHATVSGATLAGGSASGAYNHTFSSGATVLPSMSLEEGSPEIPSYDLAYGVLGDKLTLPFSRQAKFAATLALIAQGSTGSATSAATGVTLGPGSGTAIERFTNFAGAVYRDGAVIGQVMSGSLNYANNFDKAEIMRNDGRIDGADAGQIALDMSLVTKFNTRKLFDIASAKTPVEVRASWSISALKKLTFIQHRVFLPKVKIPINNPNGIQVTYNLKSAEQLALAKSFSVVVTNDVSTYA